MKFVFTRTAVTCEECGEDKPRDGGTHCVCGCSAFSQEPAGCWLMGEATRVNGSLKVTVEGHDFTKNLTAEERREALSMVTSAARLLS